MFKKLARILTMLLIPVIFPSLMYSISTSEFDNLINFSTSITDFKVDGSGDSGIDTNKIVLLDGSMSMVYPQTSYWFLPGPDDFYNTEGFLNELRNKNNPVSSFLVRKLTSKTKTALSESSDQKSLLKNVLKDLNKIFKKQSIYSPSRFKALPDLTAKIALMELKGDEAAFLNRLLMDEAYSRFLSPVKMEIEVIKGVWQGYENVEKFKVLISFQGPECFKIYKRRKITDGSDLMIALNAKVLVVAAPLKVVDNIIGEEVWLLEGFYVKELR